MVILTPLLLFASAALTNAFGQAGLSRKRKGLFMTLAIASAIIPGFLSLLGNLLPAQYTYFLLGLACLFCLVSLSLLWKAWPGSKAITSEAEIRKILLKGIRENVELRLKSVLCDRVNLPLSNNLSPEHLQYPPDSEGSFPNNKHCQKIVRVVKTFWEPKKPIIEPIIEVFQDSEIQGKLLILGDPGSGKTTELLKLAQNLCKVAAEDENNRFRLFLNCLHGNPN